MQNAEKLLSEVEKVLNDPQNDSEYERAKLAMILVESVYKFVKFKRPGGEGLDGRDGDERQGLAKVVDAAKNYEFEALKKRNKALPGNI